MGGAYACVLSVGWVSQQGYVSIVPIRTWRNLRIIVGLPRICKFNSPSFNHHMREHARLPRSAQPVHLLCSTVVAARHSGSNVRCTARHTVCIDTMSEGGKTEEGTPKVPACVVAATAADINVGGVTPSADTFIVVKPTGDAPKVHSAVAKWIHGMGCWLTWCLCMQDPLPAVGNVDGCDEHTRGYKYVLFKVCTHPLASRHASVIVRGS